MKKPFLKTNKKKILQSFLLVGSVLGSAAISYTLTHNPIMFLVIAALLVHEFGHYFVARLKNADPDLPYLVPIFPFIIGITRIKNIQTQHAPSIFIAGPIFGILTILAFILFNSYLLIFPIFPLLFMLAFEILFNYFGPDGRMYRSTKSQTV